MLRAHVEALENLDACCLEVKLGGACLRPLNFAGERQLEAVAQLLDGRLVLRRELRRRGWARARRQGGV